MKYNRRPLQVYLVSCSSSIHDVNQTTDWMLKNGGYVPDHIKSQVFIYYNISIHQKCA
jgi:hypothetical protein